MRFGLRLRTLWHLRAGVAGALCLSVVLALWSAEKITLSPPGLAPRVEQKADATLSVMIDQPGSPLTDLREDTGSLPLLTSRAVLLGTIMAGEPVRQAIAKASGAPIDELQINPPLMEPAPKAEVERPTPGAEGTTTQEAQPTVSNADKTLQTLSLSDRYSVTIRANATVPLLDLYARAPTPREAEALADAAAAQSQAYIARLARRQDTPAKLRIKLVALGHARGAAINPGGRSLTPLIVFLVTFSIACSSLIFFTRVRDELRDSGGAEARRVPAR
jgi:hypothetical protein